MKLQTAVKVETAMRPTRTDFDFTPPTLREVSLRVARVNGINLGQGTSQIPTPPEVIKAAQNAMQEGLNRYCPAQGIADLLKAFVKKLADFNHINVDTNQVLITAGATGAFEAVVQALVTPGDEVIMFRPFYPYHRNAVLRNRGHVRICELQSPNWEFSKDEFEKCFTPKTKLVVLTTPNNPTGKVFTVEELKWIGNNAKERGVWVVVDEVYEYLTYDGRRHVSMASILGLENSTITMGSFSKTYSITGWRVGYLSAPAKIMPQLIAISDQLYVCAPTPLQHAIARSLVSLPSGYYEDMRLSYEQKRDNMAASLRKAGFDFTLPEGAYYFLVSTKRRFPKLTATEVLDLMISKAGIGAVPTIDFVGPELLRDKSQDHLLRFCFSVPDDVLAEANKRLELFS
jgi:aminotransferase